MTSPAPQQLAEHALAAAQTDGCVVLVEHGRTANLRWANNTLTTNGVTTDISVTVIATLDGAQGTAAGVVAQSAVTPEQVTDLVRAAEASARAAGPADDAQALIEGDAEAAFDEEPGDTSEAVFADFSSGLGEAFGTARAEQRVHYGFVEHQVTTTYLATSTGLRRRHVQPEGYLSMTGKSADLARSAWVGRSTQDFADIDPSALDSDLAKRLGWAQRRVDLPAGRYDTVLPPAAVADLMIYLYWTAGARDAHDGQTVFSRMGGGTRVGETLSDRAVTLRSDPHAPGLTSAPFVIAGASGPASSVFDNGLDLAPTSWIADGELSALLQTRRSAEVTGLACTPAIGNLVLETGDPTASMDELLADVERGLLLTCLWYIREVDPQTLLLTGLTRDGVYLVENGEITGAVNNFRFNESPVDLLSRFSGSSPTERSLSREWGDYFGRTATPALRIPDFNMSSVSPAN